VYHQCIPTWRLDKSARRKTIFPSKRGVFYWSVLVIVVSFGRGIWKDLAGRYCFLSRHFRERKIFPVIDDNEFDNMLAEQHCKGCERLSTQLNGLPEFFNGAKWNGVTTIINISIDRFSPPEFAPSKCGFVWLFFFLDLVQRTYCRHEKLN